MFNLTCSLSECATELSYYDNRRSEAPSTNATYSHIIVGGGTAGAVLANKLSSNSQNQVLLLEAGPRANWAVSIPLGQSYIITFMRLEGSRSRFARQSADRISFSFSFLTLSLQSVSNIRVYDPKFGFQLKTVPQENLHNRRIDTFSGKLLGGTSAVNASVFTKSCHEELVGID